MWLVFGPGAAAPGSTVVVDIYLSSIPRAMRSEYRPLLLPLMLLRGIKAGRRVSIKTEIGDARSILVSTDLVEPIPRIHFRHLIECLGHSHIVQFDLSNRLRERALEREAPSPLAHGPDVVLYPEVLDFRRL